MGVGRRALEQGASTARAADRGRRGGLVRLPDAPGRGVRRGAGSRGRSGRPVGLGRQGLEFAGGDEAMTNRPVPHLLTALATALVVAGCSAAATSAPSPTAAPPSNAVTRLATQAPSAFPSPTVTAPSAVAAI